VPQHFCYMLVTPENWRRSKREAAWGCDPKTHWANAPQATRPHLVPLTALGVAIVQAMEDSLIEDNDYFGFGMPGEVFVEPEYDLDSCEQQWIPALRWGRLPPDEAAELLEKLNEFTDNASRTIRASVTEELLQEDPRHAEFLREAFAGLPE